MRDVKEPAIRRAEIMEAALMLFMEKGYMNTTTQDIIDRVKISRGLLYYHFKDKEDILYCLVERYSEPLLQTLFAISADRNKSAIEKLRSFMAATIISPDTITKEMMALQKTVDLEQNYYLMDKFSHNFIRKVTVCFADIIEQGIAEKSFHVDYPQETAYFLMTGYVFTSNDPKLLYSSPQKADAFLVAIKLAVARTLGTDPSVFTV